ncbi:MAG: hypothetical protein HOP32_16390 [Nitrospira sp.]|nr:hypothetical protein [Nitrospira sp.]
MPCRCGSPMILTEHLTVETLCGRSVDFIGICARCAPVTRSAPRPDADQGREQIGAPEVTEAFSRMVQLMTGDECR